MTNSPDPSIRIVEAQSVSGDALSAFFVEAFGVDKAHFLTEHGDWWHRGSGNRYVALCDDEVAGYRGIIPTVCLLDGKELPAVWGVDLFVLPRFRGLGLQRLLDQRLADASNLVMSFPGQLGAEIYAKQGYGLRQEMPVLRASLAAKPLAPARPGASGLAGHLVSRYSQMGFRESARRAVARVRTASSHKRTTAYKPSATKRVQVIDPESVEQAFLLHVNPDAITTLKSADYVRWRYLEAPYRSHLAFYVTSTHGRPALYAIVRHLPGAPRQARILDVIGDHGDVDGLTDIVRTIMRDATREGVEEVGVLASSPGLLSCLERAGFAPHYLKRFRWRSADPAVHERLRTAQLHWALGDSDADRPQ